MDASLISSQTVDLVSRLTGEKLRQEDINSPMLFLAALMILLQGVIYADGTVSAEETQRLETTLRELIPTNNSWQQLARLMFQGLEEQQAYPEIQNLLELTSSFSEEEKLYFTKSLEHFLTKELGEIALQNSAERIKQIIDNSCDELSQYAKILEGKLTVSQEDKLKIFEQLAEVSGRDIKIKLLTNKLKEKSVKEVKESWEEWLKGLSGLSDRITAKSAKWTSKHSQIWSQDKLIRDYVNQFIGEITEDIDGWANQKFLKIVQENMAVLDPEIAANITAIREEFRLFDQRLHTSLITQFNNLPITKKINVIYSNRLGIASLINPNIGGARGFIGGGIGGLVTTGLLVFFTGLGTIPVILGGLAAAASGSLGLGLLDIDDIHKQTKQKVVELGLQQFYQSLDNIFDKISERTNLAFNYRYETISNATAQAMLLWENLLEQQERYEQKTQQECEVEKAWVADKIRELKQMEKQIELICNPSTQ